MTEKLKTLKDTSTEEEMADWFEDIKEFNVKRITRVVKGGIKQEAIKEVKSLDEKANPRGKKLTKQFYADQQAAWNQRAWITDFFNITEEDLE